jgi:hypothetical protein
MTFIFILFCLPWNAHINNSKLSVDCLRLLTSNHLSLIFMTGTSFIWGTSQVVHGTPVVLLRCLRLKKSMDRHLRSPLPLKLKGAIWHLLCLCDQLTKTETIFKEAFTLKINSNIIFILKYMYKNANKFQITMPGWLLCHFTN